MRFLHVPAEATRAATQTGLVARGDVGTGDLRRPRASGSTEAVVLDAGLWTRTAASVATPMSRPAPDGLFCPTEPLTGTAGPSRSGQSGTAATHPG